MGKTMKNLLVLNYLTNWDSNFDGMVLGWSPFRIVSVGPEVHPRWPPSADIVLT